MLKKKGISPLIATVLLISFVVIIAVSVFLWYGGILEGEILKRGAASEIESDCLSVINLDVSNAEPSANGDKILVTIRNTGSEIFHGVRFIGDSGGDKNVVLSEKEMFKPGDVKELEFDCPGCGDKIQIMPMIVRQGIAGTCSSKKVVYNLQN